jgi:hypothetical protein
MLKYRILQSKILSINLKKEVFYVETIKLLIVLEIQFQDIKEEILEELVSNRDKMFNLFQM